MPRTFRGNVTLITVLRELALQKKLDLKSNGLRRGLRAETEPVVLETN